MDDARSALLEAHYYEALNWELRREEVAYCTLSEAYTYKRQYSVHLGSSYGQGMQLGGFADDKTLP